MIVQVSKKIIFVLPVTDFPFGAKYDGEKSTIYINLNLGAKEKKPSYSTAKKVHAFIMELCNAAYFQDHLFAALRKLPFGLDGYVEEVERGEYRLLFKANRVFEHIVSKKKEFQGYLYPKPFNDFRRHYLEQQLYGHSEWIAKVSLHKGVYLGTWKHPIEKEEERSFLKSVIRDFDKGGVTPELLAKVDRVRDSCELYENACHFIEGDEAFLESSEEKPLYVSETVSPRRGELGLLSCVRSQLSEYSLFQRVLQIVSNLYGDR